MKTPDEIKKALRICSGKLLDYCDACNYCNWSSDCACNSRMCADALDYIQQLENHIGELTEKVAKLEAAQPKWISVEDRLPDDHGNFYTKIHCDNGDWIEINTFDNTEKEWWHDTGNRVVEATEFVTHWIPMPELPKEEA